MFKYLALSIIVLPILIGLGAAASRDLAVGRRALRFKWFLFAVFWVGLLHFLRYRWQ